MVDNKGFDRVLQKVNVHMNATLTATVFPSLQPVRPHCFSVTDSCVLPQVEVLAATPGKVVCEMRVEEEHTNRGGTLHGGLTATLVDVISTMAIMNSERGAPGVSVDMNITWVYTKLIVITHLISTKTTGITFRLTWEF